MDFRHLIVTCLFSMLRLPFDNQKVKENYAIFLRITDEIILPTFYPSGLSSSIHLLQNEHGILPILRYLYDASH